MPSLYSEYDRDSDYSYDSDDDPCPNPMNYSDPRRWRQIDEHRRHIAEKRYRNQLPKFKPFRMELTDTYTVEDKTRDVTKYFENISKMRINELRGAVVLFQGSDEVIEKAGCRQVPELLEKRGAVVQRKLDEKTNFIVYVEPNFTEDEQPRVDEIRQLNQVFEVEELFEDLVLHRMKDNGRSVRQLGDK